MKKWSLVAALTICLILVATVGGTWYFEERAKRQEAADRKAQGEILEYVGKHGDRVFNYTVAAKELKLSNDQLVEHLFELQRSGRIKVCPRHSARKPIIITHDDRSWYFHQVTLLQAGQPVPPCPLFFPGTQPPNSGEEKKD